MYHPQNLTVPQNSDLSKHSKPTPKRALHSPVNFAINMPLLSGMLDDICPCPRVPGQVEVVVAPCNVSIDPHQNHTPGTSWAFD